MKPRSILVLVLLVLVGIVVYKIVFVPVSVGITSTPKKIFINSSSPVDIRVVALNKIGFGVPFMRLQGKFEIPEGASKIQIVRTGADELMFNTKSTTGKLVVLYYTPAVPFPVEIVLNIETSAMAFRSLSVPVPG